MREKPANEMLAQFLLLEGDERAEVLPRYHAGEDFNTSKAPSPHLLANSDF